MLISSKIAKRLRRVHCARPRRAEFRDETSCCLSRTDRLTRLRSGETATQRGSRPRAFSRSARSRQIAETQHHGFESYLLVRLLGSRNAFDTSPTLPGTQASGSSGMEVSCCLGRHNRLTSIRLRSGETATQRGSRPLAFSRVDRSRQIAEMQIYEFESRVTRVGLGRTIVDSCSPAGR
jgi:hypothetical protein